MYAFLMAGGMLALSGAPSSIGIIRSNGEFKLNGAAVRGNSTLISGNSVESTTAKTVINVGPSEITLLPESRATLYSDHTLLQRGTTLLRGTSSHALEAGQLRIVPVSDNSLVEVGFDDRKLIRIAAHTGAAEVFTSSGELLASLSSGSGLTFGPASGGSSSGQASANAGIELKGKLVEKSRKYFVVMDGKTYEVSSRTVNLGKYVGKVIDVNGTIVATSTESTTVEVGSVSSAAAAKSSGLSGRAVVAIVAGMAAVGTVAGLAAVGSRKSISAP